MHEQQVIYDGPYDNTNESVDSKMSNAKKSRQHVMKSLVQAFSILAQTSPTNTQISQSHKILNQQQKNQQILQIFFELIQQFSYQNNQIMIKLVITQIFTYMKKQSSFGFQSKHDRFQINKKFLQFFVNYPQVNHKFKRMLENSYMQFIYASHNVKIRERTVSFIENKFIEIFSTTKQSLKAFQQYNSLASPINMFIPPVQIFNQTTFNLVKSLSHVLRCLFIGGNLQLQQIKSILPDAFSIYYRMTLQLVKSILISIKNQQEEAFSQAIQDCTRFTQILLFMVSKLDTGKFPTLKQRIMHTKQFHQLLLILLNISPQFQVTQNIQNILLSPQIPQTGLQQSEQQARSLYLNQITTFIQQLKFKQNFITKMWMVQQSNKKTYHNILLNKKNAFQILIKLTKTLIRKKQNQVQKKYPYLVIVSGLLWNQVKDCLLIKTQQYLKNLQNVSLDEQYKHKQQNQLYIGLISSSVKFLALCVQLPYLYPLVKKSENQVIFNIALPWLISRKQHYRKYQAQDYLFFREDIVNKQNMSYIENSIGSLVEAYLDNIDGAITSLMVNSMNLVTAKLIGKSSNMSTVQNQNIATQLRNSWVVNFYPIESQIEGCLTLIAIVSYLSLSRNDLVLMLQKWIFNHRNFFLQINNDFRITVQFLILYSYYADNFYWNLIKGKSAQQNRAFHKQVLKFCCYLMKQNYDYQNNTFSNKNGKQSGILYLQAIDCLSNSLNDTQLIPALYYAFPPKQQLSIPHYMGSYNNYPYYPISNQGNTKKSMQKQPQTYQALSYFDSSKIQPKKQQQQQNHYKQLQSQLLVHYRKIGLNKIQYINGQQVVQIIQFLSQNFQARANVKVIETMIEFLINYLKSQIKNQGALINVPIVFRDEVATLLSLKIYDLMTANKKKFPNRGLFMTKSTQLLHVLHCISNDPYYIYTLGLQKIWQNPSFWHFNVQQQDSNIDQLLKCTDLVVRLALKHFSSQKNVNINQLLNHIADNICQYSYQYIKKMFKFNILFGILLNLILLKIKPEQIFDYLFIMIKQKFMTAELGRSDFNQQQQNSKHKLQQIPSSSASQLLQQSFYLFLMNMYRNPQCFNTQKNFTLLTIFAQYLSHYLNAFKIVTQIGDIFGKIFTCSICILEREYILNNSLANMDPNVLEFFWRNILYSGKLYKSQLERRIMATKMLNLIKQIIRRNDEKFDLQRVQNMYQLAASCVFYTKNKDLMENDDEQQGDFDHAGEEEEWENSPITLRNNSISLYLEDQVQLLKTVSRQLLESSVIQIKQWMTKVIEGLPVAVRNFVKNKVINYDKQSKDVGLRKIVKVRRQFNKEQQNANKKQQIIRQNVSKRNQQLNDQNEQD